jgi:flagellar motor switch protein FliN/FliY
MAENDEKQEMNEAGGSPDPVEDSATDGQQEVSAEEQAMLDELEGGEMSVEDAAAQAAAQSDAEPDAPAEDAVSEEEQAMLDELEGGTSGDADTGEQDEEVPLYQDAVEMEGEGEEEGESISPEEQAMLQQLSADEGIPVTEEAEVTAHPVELSEVEPTQPARGSAAEEAEDENLKMILDIPVDVHVEVGTARAAIRDILKLGTGSVIELDRLAGQPADIIANGKLIGWGDVVIVNENFGVRITKIVRPEERVEAL